MNGRAFARQRALIEWRARSEQHRRKAMDRLVRQAGALAIFVSRKLVGYRLPDGFVVCEKRRYKTEADALLEISGIRAFLRINGEHRVPVRAYQCAFCKGWHTTSQPLRIQREAE